MDDEEKKRQAIGMSSWRTALDLKALVVQGEAQRGGRSDAALAVALLGARKELKHQWKEDTCRRYLLSADRFDATNTEVMNRWELSFGRHALVDNMNTLRSASTSAQTPAEMKALLETLYWEQVCRLRRSVTPKGRTNAGDRVGLFRTFCCGCSPTSTASRSSPSWERM